MCFFNSTGMIVSTEFSLDILRSTSHSDKNLLRQPLYVIPVTCLCSVSKRRPRILLKTRKPQVLNAHIGNPPGPGKSSGLSFSSYSTGGYTRVGEREKGRNSTQEGLHGALPFPRPDIGLNFGLITQKGTK